MQVLKWLGIALLALLLLAVLVGQLGLLRGKAPADLGLRDGKLKAPSTRPNSVSSQADLWPTHPRRDYARIAPLALRADTLRGGAPAVMAAVKAAVLATPGALVVDEKAGYLYAHFSTRLMKYTDDVEFWFDAGAGVVQVRSASRLGESDLGANRARIEALRAQLAG